MIPCAFWSLISQNSKHTTCPPSPLPDRALGALRFLARENDQLHLPLFGAFHHERAGLPRSNLCVLTSASGPGQRLSLQLTQRQQVGPVFGRILEEKCPSHQLASRSFISVIWEHNIDSIRPNKRYILILFSVFCLDRED